MIGSGNAAPEKRQSTAEKRVAPEQGGDARPGPQEHELAVVRG